MRRYRTPDLDPLEFKKLEEFRFQIRRFINSGESAARVHGIEAQQHQALLVLKGMATEGRPTIGHLAERLLLKHHSAVGLVDRLQALGLVKRQASPDDAREVLISLTTKGEGVLHSLSVAHRAELEEAGPKLASALQAIARKKGLPKAS